MADNWSRYRIRKPEPKTESFLSLLIPATRSLKTKNVASIYDMSKQPPTQDLAAKDLHGSYMPFTSERSDRDSRHIGFKVAMPSAVEIAALNEMSKQSREYRKGLDGNNVCSVLHGIVR
ncbi:hypothetical protein Tco_0543306 [Tanacetum coccineum]